MSHCLNDAPSNKKVTYQSKTQSDGISNDTPEVIDERSETDDQIVDLKGINQDKALMSLPGQLTNGDEQCRLQLGEGHYQCSQTVVKITQYK